MNKYFTFVLLLLWIVIVFAVMEGVSMDKYISVEHLLMLLPIILLIMLVVFFIKKSNKLKRYQIIIDESKKNVDIALAKRYDTILQMLKIAKSYAAYEKTTFIDLVKLRGSASVSDFNKTINDQDKVIGKIYALAEAYPELRSSEEFLNLQNQIDDENEQLAAAKRIVNSNISLFNQEIVAFPTSIVAKINGLKRIEFMKEDNIDIKKNIDNLD